MDKLVRIDWVPTNPNQNHHDISKMKWPLAPNTKSETKTLKRKIPSGLNYSYIV